MYQEEPFFSNRSFAETSRYLRESFFSNLEPFLPKSVAGMYDENENPRRDTILPLPPEIVTDEPKKFGMAKAVGARVTVSAEVEEDAFGKVMVTAWTEADLKKNIVHGCILTALTCGLAGLVFAPLIYFRYTKWKRYSAKVMEVLKKELAA